MGLYKCGDGIAYTHCGGKQWTCNECAAQAIWSLSGNTPEEGWDNIESCMLCQTCAKTQTVLDKANPPNHEFWYYNCKAPTSQITRNAHEKHTDQQFDATYPRSNCTGTCNLCIRTPTGSTNAEYDKCPRPCGIKSLHQIDIDCVCHRHMRSVENCGNGVGPT